MVGFAAEFCFNEASIAALPTKGSSPWPISTPLGPEVSQFAEIHRHCCINVLLMQFLDSRRNRIHMSLPLLRLVRGDCRSSQQG